MELREGSFCADEGLAGLEGAGFRVFSGAGGELRAEDTFVLDGVAILPVIRCREGTFREHSGWDEKSRRSGRRVHTKAVSDNRTPGISIVRTACKELIWKCEKN
jgi:hypothetical protein